jgi:cobaltochelatase CobT
MVFKTDNPADPFKKALGEATRALAGEPELDVSYSADPPGKTNSGLRLPQVSRRMTRAEVMLARGTADSFALRERFHNPVTNARYAPPGETARAIFDALESARCEAIGARAMEGVANNLDARLSADCDRRGYQAMKSSTEAPMAEAAGFLMRQKLTGRPLPTGAQNVLDLWQDFFDGHLESDLASSSNLEDQTAFAKRAWKIIEELGYGDQLGQDPDAQDPEDLESDQDDQQEEDQQDGEEGGEDDGQQDEYLPDDMRGEQDDTQQMEVTLDESDQDSDDQDQMEADDGMPPPQPREVPISDADPNYNVFTQKFDEVIPAEELSDEAELERLRAYLDMQLEPLKGAVSRLAN